MTEELGQTGMLVEYARNPFINRLPTEPETADLRKGLYRPPLFNETDRLLRPGQRLHCVMRLDRFSLPTIPAMQFARALDIVIKRGYVGRDPTTTDFVRGVELAVENEERVVTGVRWDDLTLVPEYDTSIGFAALGTPGGGKTHAVVSACARYTQVIRHTAPFLLHQIVWLRVECPPGGSPKSLCEYFFQEVDRVMAKNGVATRYQRQYRGKTLDLMMAGMARVATLHAVGVLIVDEIQNVRKTQQDMKASVLNFLVTMRNSIGIPVVTVGTMAAQRLLRRTFHDARRGDGLGSIYFERLPPGSKSGPGYGPEFESFVTRMWRWQWTTERTEIDPGLLTAMYHETQGVLDLTVKLYILVQQRLISRSDTKRRLPEVITADLIHEVAKDRLRIVQPFVKALREDDVQALLEFEDLVDFHRAFQNYVSGIGFTTEEPVAAESHGTGTSAAAAVPAGIVDESTFDVLLAGQGIPEERRAWIMDRTRQLLAGDDLGSVMTAMAEAIKADRERSTPRKRAVPKRTPAPVAEGDLRSVASKGDADGLPHAKLVAAGHIGFGDDL